MYKTGLSILVLALLIGCNFACNLARSKSPGERPQNSNNRNRDSIPSNDQNNENDGPTESSNESTQQNNSEPPRNDEARSSFSGKVINVHDGDTITILDHRQIERKIRLAGIDAPEIGQDFGKRSKVNLLNMVIGREVQVSTSKNDKYNRIVGKVVINGNDVNLAQIIAGLAWHYKKYESEQDPDDRTKYTEEELLARKGKRGLWVMSAPIPPWDERAGKGSTNLEGVPQAAIIGNKNSRIYHLPGCPSYSKVSKNNQILFETASDAEAEGFRIAKNCNRRNAD